MKVWTTILLAGLLLLTAAPGFTHETSRISGVPVELGYDNGVPDRDDPFDDWIFYDNDQPTTLNTAENYWSKVIFTPLQRFELQAVRLTALNQAPNNDDHMLVRVYSLGDGNDLDEMLWEHEIEQVNEWGQDAAHYIEIPEDDRPIFEENENFTIMYNSPGGAYNPNDMQDGDGWWNIFDGATEVNRSYINGVRNHGDDPSDDHGDWGRALAGDLLIRANGEYLVDFVDLEALALYNLDGDDEENGRWLAEQGSETTFKLDIANSGGDVDVAVVILQVEDLEGNDVWDNQVMVEDIGGGDTITVDADEAWPTPEQVGPYKVWALIEVEDDANFDNNQIGLDQFVYDREFDFEGDDLWLTYTDGTMESFTNFQEGSGWAVAFFHPGHGDPLEFGKFRAMVYDEEAGIECGYNVMTYDPMENPPLTVYWEGTAETTGEGVEAGDGVYEWLEPEVAFEDDLPPVIRPGQAFIVTYFFAEGAPFPSDNNAPFAGTNESMPRAMWQTSQQQGNQVWFPTSSGDFPIEVELLPSDRPEEGPHLRIEPNPMDFGYNLELGQEHVIEANFINFGDEDVEVSALRIAQSAADFVTVDPQRDFTVAAQETLIVTATFSAEVDTMLDRAILVQSNAAENPIVWNFHASTYPPPALIRVEPEELEFGYDLALGEEHQEMGYIYNDGETNLVVSNIEIPVEFADYFSIDTQGEFSIEPHDSQMVSVTFQTDHDVMINTFFTIESNSAQEPEYEWIVQASTGDGVRTNPSTGLPQAFEMSQNHPNPFNPTTTIDFALPAASEIEFGVFDMSGRKVHDVHHSNLPAGFHSIDFDANGLPAGVYVYRLIAGDFVSTKKMVLMR